jgi:MHS family shikimate/dehydroshikimate transporter-like MFS transporter
MNPQAIAAGGDTDLYGTSAEVRAVVWASAIGTVIEWYDFALYGAASALIINRLFFPNVSPLVGTLAAFATFAVGFFARPLGGFVVVHYGDKVGRRPALILTVALMGTCTVLIGLLPSFNTLGIWAPVLLVLARLGQGFGAGAELAGAITYISDHTPYRKRAFYTSIPNACTAVGLVLAFAGFALMRASLDEAAFLSWGWRVPFLLSVVILGVAIYIRRNLHEAPSYEKAKAQGSARLPVAQVISERGRDAFLGFLSVTGHNANAYLINAFALSYVVNTLHVPAQTALVSLLIAAVIGCLTTPLFGLLADRIGRKAVFIFGAVFNAAFVFPLFALLGTGDTMLITLAMSLGYGIGFGATSGGQGAFLAELFDTRYRYTGIAIVREMNGVLIAGPTPFIATALVAAASGSPWMVAVYIILCQVLTIIGVAAAQPSRT